MTEPTGIDQAVAKAAEQAAAAGKPRSGQVQLAEELGVSQQLISRWVLRGWVPPERVVEIEALYGVPRKQLLKPSLVDLVE